MRFSERERLIRVIGCPFRIGVVLVVFLGLVMSKSVAQEKGQLETFGNDGRQYAKDRHLLSRKSYLSEDLFAYEGQFRVLKRFKGGGYELETLEYFATCRSFDNVSSISTFNQGKHDQPLSNVTIDRGKRPPASLVNAYNLYWAACEGQFQKFK